MTSQRPAGSRLGAAFLTLSFAVPAAGAEDPAHLPIPVFEVAPGPGGSVRVRRGGEDARGGVVRLALVGDLMFGRRVEERRRREGVGNPLGRVAESLTSADLTFGNLECVLGTPEEAARWGGFAKIRLLAPPRAARWLAEAGFDAVSLGNNHALDFGAAGLAATARRLGRAGVASFGIWTGREETVEPLVLEAGGRRVALLSYSNVSPAEFEAGGKGRPGTIPPLAERLARDLPRAKALSDFLMVFVHWGVEGRAEPVPGQRRLARRLAELGADAVVGHHPHVLQPFAFEGGCLVAYSLGNFLFDQELRAARESLVLWIHLPREGPFGACFSPVSLEDGYPRFLEEGELEGWFARHPFFAPAEP